MPKKILEAENLNIKIQLPSDANGNITIKINNQNKIIPIKNGKAETNITNLQKGKHNITITYTGNNKYYPITEKSTITVTENKNIKIKAENLTIYYKNGTRYYITLQDKNNKPLPNQEITINIHGVNMTRTTDQEGKTSIAINLNPKTYKITIIYKGQLPDRKSVV